MKRLWLATMISGLAAWLGSCEDDRERNPIRVTVEKRIQVITTDGTVTCYALCQESESEEMGMVMAGLRDRCEDIDGVLTESPRCGLVAGQDTIRVSVGYGVSIVSGHTPPTPTLALLLDEEVNAMPVTFDVVPESSKGSGPVATAVFTAPKTRASSLVFRATVPPDLSAEAPGFSIDPPTPSLEIVACGDDVACSLPAGVGAATLRLRLPRGFAGERASISASVNGVPQALPSMSSIELRAAGEIAEGTVAIPIPDGVGRTWHIEAEIAGLLASADASLHAPRVPVLDVVVPGETLDFVVNELPPRVMGEPDVACRSYEIGVLAPDPPGSEIMLETSVGSLGGNGTTVQLALDASDQAFTKLVLPGSDTTGEVRLMLQVDVRRRLVVPLPLAPVLPVEGLGRLTASARRVTVGDVGIPDGVRLSGAVATRTGARFAPGTTVLVRTRVVQVNDDSLPCGSALEPTAVACDPLDPNPLTRGGCLLFDPAADVGPDGSFTLAAQSALCFAGEVVVEALSRAYLAGGNAACLGELPASEAPLLMGVTSLTFEAPASLPNPS